MYLVSMCSSLAAALICLFCGLGIIYDGGNLIMGLLILVLSIANLGMFLSLKDMFK